MRVLVTGGAGFIGSSFAKKARQQGWQVTVLDNLSTGHKSTFDELEKLGIRVIIGDIRNRELLSKEMLNCTAVIHLAAQASVPLSVAVSSLPSGEWLGSSVIVFSADAREAAEPAGDEVPIADAGDEAAAASIFAFLMLLYFSCFERPGRPYQGRLPFKKYSRTCPIVSRSSRRDCSNP